LVLSASGLINTHFFTHISPLNLTGAEHYSFRICVDVHSFASDNQKEHTVESNSFSDLSLYAAVSLCNMVFQCIVGYYVVSWGVRF